MTPVESSRKTGLPRSDLERQLAATWAELLEFDHIGVDQDVFALGADSLTVTQMISRLRTRFGVDFSFQNMFDMPTVAALAARLESSPVGHSATSPSLLDAPTDDRGVRLSFQQHRIYLPESASSDQVQLSRSRRDPTIRASQC